jgi:hypothetical protein
MFFDIIISYTMCDLHMKLEIFILMNIKKLAKW